MRRPKVGLFLAALGFACRTSAPAPSAPQAPASIDRVHVGGRVQADGASLLHSWPGVYFEARFAGTSIGVALDDPVGDYRIEIDGKLRSTVRAPGRATVPVRGLAAGTHTIRVSKRNETVATSPRFSGFIPPPDGEVLDPPAKRRRQIEFIGDSWTAGFGNTSATRECSSAEIAAHTDVDQAFSVLTARHFDADYQVNAYSGLGMVRNWDGNLEDLSFRTYYDRALVGVEGNVWVNPGDWKPQLVVVLLGINDFSTAVKGSERWTESSLAHEYKGRYREFLAQLRARYGEKTVIVVGATHLDASAHFASAAQAIVEAEQAAGHPNVLYWYFDGLSLAGCLWHPSLLDHRHIAQKLIAFIDGRPGLW